MSQPIIEPATMPVGIAHQRPSPLESAAPRPPPTRPPAILPSVQSLLSYSMVVLRVYPPDLKDSGACLQGTSMVS